MVMVLLNDTILTSWTPGNTW